MAEEKTFRYGFIILGFFLVMVGMFIMSVEKPQFYITFCVLGVLLVAVGITWSMCQCYPKITFIPADLEAQRFLDYKPMVLPQKDTRWVPQWGNVCALRAGSDTGDSCTHCITKCQAGISPARPAPGDAPLASLLEEMDTPSLEGSVPGSPTPQSRTLPCASRTPAGGEHSRSPRKGPGEEDDLYYGLQEEPDSLLKESDGLFEPEN
ncbi:BSND protein, partial [Pomatorhinus ruficollis]|nr:BSND protein [Pomatorhinus ruficollis]